MVNNFTENGNGASVEINTSYDSGLAQMYFDDNFVRLGGNDSDKFFYVDWGNVGKHDLKTMYTVTNDTRENVIKEILEQSDEYPNNTGKKELEKMSNPKLKEELNAWSDHDHDERDFYEFDQENFGEITTRGYSQGDYAEIYYSKKDLKECWGNDVDENNLKKSAENLFWNHPLWFQVIIDGKDFDGLIDNEYMNFDDAKEQVEEKIKKEVSKEQFDEFKKILDKTTENYL